MKKIFCNHWASLVFQSADIVPVMKSFRSASVSGDGKPMAIKVSKLDSITNQIHIKLVKPRQLQGTGDTSKTP